MKIKILNLFVKRYFTKAKRVRISDEKRVVHITNRINKIFREYFDFKIGFTEDEIINVFKNNGFVTSDDSNILHPRFGKLEKNSVSNYIHIDTQIIKDFYSISRRGTNRSWNDDTRHKMESLKRDLNTFKKVNISIHEYH